MIEAKSLRLGNEINFCVKSIEMSNGIITSIESDCVYINTIKVELKYLKPIPLTEEWLVKFGIVPTAFGHRKFKNYDFGLINKENSGVFRYDYYDKHIRLKHVHSLQNLYFALTNTELEIKDI